MLTRPGTLTPIPSRDLPVWYPRSRFKELTIDSTAFVGSLLIAKSGGEDSPVQIYHRYDRFPWMNVHSQDCERVIEREHFWTAAALSMPGRPFTYPSLADQLIHNCGHSTALKPEARATSARERGRFSPDQLQNNVSIDHAADVI